MSLLNTARFLALLFAALALVPSGAHRAELWNKISLPASEYLTVQQIYRGWQLAGVVVVGALVSIPVLTIMSRRARRTFRLTLVALLCIVGTQVVFWTFTFPANQATANWTMLPSNWAEVRDQWEYSHATSAVLNFVALLANFVALLALILSTVVDRSE